MKNGHKACKITQYKVLKIPPQEQVECLCYIYTTSTTTTTQCKLQSAHAVYANRCRCPVPQPDLQQLALVVFSFLQLAQTLYLHLGWLLLATCTGGLVHRSTGAYTACADCNLHCVVVHGGGSGVIEGVP